MTQTTHLIAARIGTADWYRAEHRSWVNDPRLSSTQMWEDRKEADDELEVVRERMLANPRLKHFTDIRVVRYDPGTHEVSEI